MCVCSAHHEEGIDKVISVSCCCLLFLTKQLSGLCLFPLENATFKNIVCFVHQKFEGWYGNVSLSVGLH